MCVFFEIKVFVVIFIKDPEILQSLRSEQNDVLFGNFLFFFFLVKWWKRDRNIWILLFQKSKKMLHPRKKNWLSFSNFHTFMHLRWYYVDVACINWHLVEIRNLVHLVFTVDRVYLKRFMFTFHQSHKMQSTIKKSIQSINNIRITISNRRKFTQCFLFLEINHRMKWFVKFNVIVAILIP